MLRKRRAAQVLALAIVTSLIGTAIVLAFIAARYLLATSSAEAQDALLLLVIFSPQVIVASLGLAALAALLRGAPRSVRLGILWAAAESGLAVLASWRFLDLAASAVAEGRSVSWDAPRSVMVFAHAHGADHAHWIDFAAVLLLAIALGGLIAAVRLAVAPPSPARPNNGLGHPVGA